MTEEKEEVMKEDLVLGIDTGVKGAWALVSLTRPTEMYAVDNTPDNYQSMNALIATYKQNIVGCLMETPINFGLNKNTMSQFLYHSGIWEGIMVAHGVECNLIAARQWQKAFLSKFITSETKAAGRRMNLKKYCMNRANATFTNLELRGQKNFGKADALFIALAAVEYYGS